MLKIRLRRTGARKQASFRIVVADSRAARDGAFVEYLGHYNPRTDPPTIVFDRERALEWISKGAQPSDAVRHMIDNPPSPEEADA
ncbi:MAG TPA: 30S ribosomal protein S16 [Candidatus Latescibacteria bacterium]|nr:30S ribosomal protein S16 [Candidatus Latescibacterota bacterium]